MNIQTIEARLKRIDQERQRLSRQLEARKQRHFTSLPAKLGMRTVDQLIQALVPYASPHMKSRVGSNGATVSSSRRAAAGAARKVGRARRRRTYTAQQKAAVRAAVAKGDKTVSQIAKEHGVSPFSIKDWKEQWGMTKRRKNAAKKK